MDPGKELARLRKEKGLTQRGLAELAGTKTQYIWALEHGELAGIEVASKLARVLDVPLEVFWPKYKQTESVENLEKICRQHIDSPGLEILNLSQRTFNALYRAKIETVGDLLLLSEKELSRIRRLGPASQCEVQDKLKEYQSRVSDEVAGNKPRCDRWYKSKIKRKRSNIETLKEREGIRLDDSFD